MSVIFFTNLFYKEKNYKFENIFIKKIKILNDGYLGSHIDEERSEMRYVMRIAKSTSHQIFERNWRRLPVGIFVSVCKEITNLNVVEKLLKNIFLSH